MSEKFPTNNPAESENDTEKRLIAFREQIKGITAEENGSRAPGNHLILGNLKLEDLTEADMAIWEEFQSGEITEESLKTYQQSVANRREIKVGEIPNDSRSLFSGFIANVAGEVLMRRELEKERKK